MDCNRDEAFRARGLAEEKMLKNDFEGAQKIALKARNLFPDLDNISQLISVCEVHCSAQKKIFGAEKDLYGILQVGNVADEATIRKQYRKLALVLHPDKNKFPGAEAAFKLIGEANMILSDKGKRSVYDIKCREPAKASVTKIQNRQGNQSSYARTQFAAQNKFNGTNYRQQSTSHSSSGLTFWTYCPFCNIKYEYHREYVNRPLRCQHCLKLFIAYDMGVQGVARGPGFVHEKKTQTPASQQKGAGKREKVKVNIQKDGNFPSHFTGVQFAQGTKTEDTEVRGNSKQEGVTKAKETGTSKGTNRKRGRKVEGSSDVGDGFAGNGVSSGGDTVDRRRSSRQKQNVFYREDAGDELTSQKRSKSASDAEDVKKEEVSDGIMPNGNKGEDHCISDSDSSDSEPEFVECLDPEFSDFDKDKEEHCFAIGQIWACYDSVDGMPRFYANVKKVYSSEFKMQFTWLEAKPENDPEKKWAEEGLPVACGKFVHGETETTRDRLMFSHQMTFEKSGTRTYLIRPQKGEIWALFKNWDIKWSIDPESHRKYKFDIVEILSVHDNGISVAYLLKVKGFVSLFQRTNREEKIPSNEVFRFSHRIPSVKLTGTERSGVPCGSFELDPAALSGDLENEVNMEPEEKVKTTPKKHVNSEAKNGFDNETLNLRRSPRRSKNQKDNNSVCEDGVINTISKNITKSPRISSPCSKLEQVIHDFSADKAKWKFEANQIWAFWENDNGIRQCYAQIKQIDTTPFTLLGSLLRPCNIPSNYANYHSSCGLFKVSSGRPKPLTPDSFSHIVKAEESGKNIYNIYPREQQIWALYKGQDADEIVQVLESDESSIKVLSLTRVPGYKSVFQAPRIQRSTARIVVIPRMDSINRFVRQIPGFLFTEDEDGCLKGSWELDPVALRGLHLVGPNHG